MPYPKPTLETPWGDIVHALLYASEKLPFLKVGRAKFERDATVHDRLNQVDRVQPPAHEPSSSPQDDEYRDPEPVGPRAKEILESGWDFTGLNSPPRSVKDFTKSMIRESWYSEEHMSSGQLRYWRSVISHYDRWMKGRG